MTLMPQRTPLQIKTSLDLIKYEQILVEIEGLSFTLGILPESDLQANLAHLWGLSGESLSLNLHKPSEAFTNGWDRSITNGDRVGCSEGLSPH
jgi:hypothetical protein